ncbi:hypothetical protein J1N35_024355 [Gossypium stocksii]|uniref:Retrotransposon gag domain-containing protein n=1 Tax=Gossypium stocksii TaxID=47602 RepID=A0A9D3V470_9ROSI|nr:hypothetical protein J1N35_024355 [Gossypium stocksii]
MILRSHQRYQSFYDLDNGRRWCFDVVAEGGQYFGPPTNEPPANTTTDKGKGVLGAPLGFPPKDMETPNAPVGPNLPDVDSVHLRNQSPAIGVSEKASRLECPKFDGSDFWGWWTKLEQYFESKRTLECSKVHIVMLNLEGRALEWHHFYSQRNEGL